MVLAVLLGVLPALRLVVEAVLRLKLITKSFGFNFIQFKKYKSCSACVFPSSRFFFWSSGATPAPVHPVPIADPARDRSDSLIVPARVGSSEESSPGQGCDNEEKETKKDTRKKDKKNKKEKKRKTKGKHNDDNDEGEENQEHVPLSGGNKDDDDDDEDDFNDLDGMNDLLDLDEDGKASQGKDTTKKKPASSKRAPKKRPAKKHDEAG